MRPRRLLSLLFFFSIGFSSAQKSPVKFGDVPLEDLKMTAYDRDPSAEAVILSDYGEAYISTATASATLMFERHVRIKILTKEGLRWANVEIPLYRSGSAEEDLKNLKAVSYNLEGGKVVESKVASESIFKEKFTRNFNIQKFTIPNVKEGSVIEYSYKIYSDFLFNFPDWRFQYSIPVMRSEYWAVLPDFLLFEKYMQGYLPLTNFEIKNKPMSDYQSFAHHYVMNDVPAFREEPFITCEGDYVSKIKFAISHLNLPGQPTREIMGSWKKLNADLLESEAFGKAITGNSFLKKKNEEVLAGVDGGYEKMKALFNFVRSTVTWDGHNDFYADPLKKVLENKKGTTGDINILLASMLEKEGIQVDMVLLSTRDHGFVRQSAPMSDQFNYVVCMATIDDKSYLLDATDKLTPVNVLPERCLNGSGLVISKDKHGWMSLQPKSKSKTVIVADFMLDVTGELKGKVNFARDGYDAVRMRKDYVTKGEEEYLKGVVANVPWQVASTKFEDITTIDKPAREIHEVNIAENVTVAGDVMYVNPFVSGQVLANPFKSETRQYPVDFTSPQEKIYTCKFTVPDGYAVEELPKPKVIMLPDNGGKYMYSTSVTGNTVYLTSNFQINKMLFLQTEYPQLREFYSQVIAKQGEQIVLKKK